MSGQLVVVLPFGLDHAARFSHGFEPVQVQVFIALQAVERLDERIVPDREKSIRTVHLWAHRSTNYLMDSDPLSANREHGAQRCRIRRSSTSTTCSAPSRRPTSLASPSRLNTSNTVKTRNLAPPLSWSWDEVQTPGLVRACRHATHLPPHHHLAPPRPLAA